MELVIWSVESAKIQILKSNPPKIQVEALGTVSSSGWKNGRLVAHMYFKPPQDGLQDFTFIATPPPGVARPALESDFPGSGWTPMFDWLKGIRIHATTNTLEVLLTDASTTTSSLDDPHRLDNDHWPFPL